METLRKAVIRTISTLNFFFGCGYLVFGNGYLSRVWLRRGAGEHAYILVFWSRTAINAIFLVGLAISGRYLWKLSDVGLRFSNIFFTFELVYVFGLPLIENWLAATKNLKPAAILTTTDGTANMAIAPQMIVLYPFMALLLLNSRWPKSHGDDTEPSPEAITSETTGPTIGRIATNR